MSSEINDQSTGNPVIDHLDLWSSVYVKKAATGRGSNGKISPYGIQKLRELILELAVRGKLVPQDPKDEPAAVLLEKVAKQKDRLVADREIKKPKKLPEITDEEMPFALLEGWEWARLQDVTTYIQRGKGPKYAEEGEVRVVSQKCVQWSGFDLEQSRYVDDNSLDKYQQERFLQENDLLWNSTGTGTVGRINVLENNYDGTLVADSHVTVIRPLFLNGYYLWCYIAAPGIQQRIEPEHEDSLVSGTTKQVELNTSSVVPLVIPIPPLAEQHRIVAKVDELMALCDQLGKKQTDSLQAHQTLVETLLCTLVGASDAQSTQQAWNRIAEQFDTLFTTEESIDQLKQTILQLAVMGRLVPHDPDDEPATVLLEKIVEEKVRLLNERRIKKPKKLIDFQGLEELKWQLPEHWVYARLADAADIVRGGSPRPAGDPRFYGGSIPFLKVADVTRVSGKLVEGYSATITEAGLKKTRYIDTRTVLLSNSGATLGIPAICDFPATFNDGIAAFVELSEFVFDEYLYLYLKALSKWFIDIASRGQGQPNLNTDIIKATWFALPPLEEQHRIVAKVDELMALCDTLKSRIQEAQDTQINLADAVVEQAVA